MSRCLVRRVRPEAIALVRQNALWPLATTGDDRRVWERLYIGDHVILWEMLGDHFDIVAGSIVGKSLDLSVPKSERPLRLAVNVLGTARTKKLPLHAYNLRDDLFCQIGDFSNLWSQCDPCAAQIPVLFEEFFYEIHGIKIRVASSQSDLTYIEDFAATHSFGYRKAFLTLIAILDGLPVGAILAQPCLANQYPHPSTVRVFGSDYAHFRHESLAIKRIFTDKNSSNRNDLHEALLRGLVEIAPFMVEGTLRLIEGVSYDIHPLSERLGFHVELPETPTGSIYFWKPFGLPATYVDRRASDASDIARAAHDLVKARANLHFYGVFSRRQDMGRAEREKAWALQDSKENRGLWKTVRKGDVVFFIRDRRIAEGYAVVAGTRFDAALRHYPLRIDFEWLEMPYLALDLSAEPFEEVVRPSIRGGVFALGNLEGSQLKSIIDIKYSEDKMWVKPNAYLLPGTVFTTIPKRIFVVQAWSLKDSVLPILRKTLDDASYEVTHADDRQGQVIFADIWRLLNESEIVLVDFTEKRPNVYLEYGMALVLGKPIIAITQTLDDIPSDTPQLKVISRPCKIQKAIART